MHNNDLFTHSTYWADYNEAAHLQAACHLVYQSVLHATFSVGFGQFFSLRVMHKVCYVIIKTSQSVALKMHVLSTGWKWREPQGSSST